MPHKPSAARAQEFKGPAEIDNAPEKECTFLVNRRGSPAFTVKEWVILISVLSVGVVMLLALPAIPSEQVRGRMVGVMNNMRQIYLATQQMALEGVTAKDRSLCWPGDLPHPDWATFQRKLAPSYVGTNEFLKLLSAPGVEVSSNFPNPVGRNACKLFALKMDDPDDTIFIATRNWQGFQQPLSDTSPFGLRGFILIRKGGDAAIYTAKQAQAASATNGGFLGQTNGFVISQ